MHAHNHLRELNGIRSTKENLSEAINGESYEFQKMYPAMIKDAKAESIQGALRSFEWANAVGKMQVPALVAKHVLIFALVAVGAWGWLKLRRRAREMEARLG